VDFEEPTAAANAAGFSAKLLGFDSEVLPVRFLPLGITIVFALTAVAASKQVSVQSSSEHDKQELERLEKVWNEAHEQLRRHGTKPLATFAHGGCKPS
jgi:hypothetical protein